MSSSSPASPGETRRHTRQDAIALFDQIRAFCKAPVPFRLGDLNEEDRLIERIQDDHAASWKAAEKKPTTRNIDDETFLNETRPAEPPVKSQPQHDNQPPPPPPQPCKSFARLMFDFSSVGVKGGGGGGGKSRQISLPRGIKPVQVRKVVLAKKELAGGRNRHRSTTIFTAVKSAAITERSQPPPPALPCADFFARFNSCRAQMASMKAQIKAQQEAELLEAKKVRRSPATRTRNRHNLRRPEVKAVVEPLIQPPHSPSFTEEADSSSSLSLETPPPSCKTFDSSTSSVADSGLEEDDAFSPLSAESIADENTVATAAADDDAAAVVPVAAVQVDDNFIDFDGLDLLDFNDDDLIEEEQQQQQQQPLQTLHPEEADDFDAWLNDLNAATQF